MSGARPTIARIGAVERNGRELRFYFDVAWPDGRCARVQAAARGGYVVDLQADGPGGFIAGTTGDPAVDRSVRDHIAGFARGSAPRRPVTKGQP